MGSCKIVHSEQAFNWNWLLDVTILAPGTYKSEKELIPFYDNHVAETSHELKEFLGWSGDLKLMKRNFYTSFSKYKNKFLHEEYVFENPLNSHRYY